MMKRMVTLLLTALCLLSLTISAASAAEVAPNVFFELRVGIDAKPLKLRELPRAPYCEGRTLMVPAVQIARALGYKVELDEKAKTLTIDDGVMQAATLTDGKKETVFTSRLTIIDLSRTIENAAETVFLDGCVSVPVEFFEEFFNDVSVENGTILIAPSMCSIDGREAE